MTVLNNLQIKNNILNYDVCIIGSGMSGQLVSSELINKKVILVESGSVKLEKDIKKLNNYKSIGLEFRKDNINRIRQLGGSANLWANQLMLLNDNDFEDRSWIDDNCYIPINYSDLNFCEIINEFKIRNNLLKYTKGNSLRFYIWCLFEIFNRIFKKFNPLR